MIKQSAIASTLALRTKNDNLLQFAKSLSSDEWCEYLLFLLWTTHDPRTNLPNFDLELKYWFPFEIDGGKGSELGHFYRTLDDLEDVLEPEHRRRLEQGVDKLLNSHYKEDHFLRILLSETDSFSSGDDRLFDFRYETLIFLLFHDKLAISPEIISGMIIKLGDLRGSNTISRNRIRGVLIKLQHRYRDYDEVLHAIISVKFDFEMYWGILETLCFLKNTLPYEPYFTKKLKVIAEHPSVISNQGKMTSTILVSMSPKIKELLLKKKAFRKICGK